MNKFTWTDEYSLGIHIIDEQHKHFFEIVNRIYDLLEKKGADREAVLAIINELIDYGYYHLSTEEKYFNQYAYADREGHMKYHEMFRKQASEYLTQIEKEKTDISSLSLEVDNFAKDWLSHHILVADRQYVSFFKQNNID